MGRPPLPIKQRQLAVALPPETRTYLEIAASIAGHSLAEEIRQRIAKTVEWETYDPVTAEFLQGLQNIAALVHHDFGWEWHANSRAYTAYVAAVNQRLAGYEPPQRELFAASDLGLIGPTDPPETIGRMRERDEQRDGNYEYLNKARRMQDE